MFIIDELQANRCDFLDVDVHRALNSEAAFRATLCRFDERRRSGQPLSIYAELQDWALRYFSTESTLLMELAPAIWKRHIEGHLRFSAVLYEHFGRFVEARENAAAILEETSQFAHGWAEHHFG